MKKTPLALMTLLLCSNAFAMNNPDEDKKPGVKLTKKQVVPSTQEERKAYGRKINDVIKKNDIDGLNRLLGVEKPKWFSENSLTWVCEKVAENGSVKMFQSLLSREDTDGKVDLVALYNKAGINDDAKLVILDHLGGKGKLKGILTPKQLDDALSKAAGRGLKHLVEDLLDSQKVGLTPSKEGKIFSIEIAAHNGQMGTWTLLIEDAKKSNISSQDILDRSLKTAVEGHTDFTSINTEKTKLDNIRQFINHLLNMKQGGPSKDYIQKANNAGFK